jgi:hypothetical protein
LLEISKKNFFFFPSKFMDTHTTFVGQGAHVTKEVLGTWFEGIFFGGGTVLGLEIRASSTT